MHNGPLGKPESTRQTSVEQREVDRLAPRRTKDVWSILTKLPVEERIGLGHAQSSHPRQATLTGNAPKPDCKWPPAEGDIC